MIDNKVAKLADERAKLEVQLQQVKDKERKAKNELAKKARVKREAWLKVFGEVMLTNKTWNQDKLNVLLDHAHSTISQVNYKKLVEGLKSEGLLQDS